MLTADVLDRGECPTSAPALLNPSFVFSLGEEFDFCIRKFELWGVAAGTGNKLASDNRKFPRNI
jgi:hypothetical protein